jgi:hypothetical protein
MKEYSTKQDSYLRQRLSELNITEAANVYKVVTLEGRTIDFEFFKADDDDNIEIHYLTPSGEIINYDDNKKLRPFFRTRFKKPTIPKRKYYQPQGTEAIPFSTPTIINAYKKQEKVKTLYVTEGEFKAFAVSNFGLPCFGIGGIHNFKGPSKDCIHQYILNFIDVCKVENVVLLFDADCMDVEWAENKELTTRLSTFHAALTTFNELLKPHNVCLYFAHVNKEAKFKGIDDLLYSKVNPQEEIIKELSSLLEGSNSRRYIFIYKISGVSPYIVQKIFGLDNVQTFFDQHKDILQDKEFIYKGDPYYCDDTDKLQVSWKGEQNFYLRVGTKYYKKVVDTFKRDDQEISEINLKEWELAAIKADYYKSHEFLKRINKYDGFTNIPENNPNKFKQLIKTTKKGIQSILYNRYQPVYNEPTEGSWNTINKLLHHIFDYKNISGDSLYEFALDYIQLVYTRPTLHLPVICLVSKENKTGKSTFLELLRNIFNENMRILDSDRISSKFNSSWAGKLIIAIDESLIEIEKSNVKNKIKMICTNKTIPIEGKGTNDYEVPNFSKLIMCSNDENNFMRIDYEENRYCIVKVGTIPSGTEDPNMSDRMMEEIPAFLYFLEHRTLYYPQKTRLWFDESIYETPQLMKIKERTEPQLIRNIKDIIKEQFLMQKKEYIRLSLKVITEIVARQFKYADKIKIGEYLTDKGYKQHNASNFEYHLSFNEECHYYTKDRYYEFYVHDWLEDEDLRMFYSEEIEEKTNIYE